MINTIRRAGEEDAEYAMYLVSEPGWAFRGTSIWRWLDSAFDFIDMPWGRYSANIIWRPDDL